MPDELTITAAAIGASGYVAAKLFGSTLDAMGSDLNKAYQKGRDKILQKASSKVSNPEDGKQANLRVARDVLWNGAITNDEVCSEYFGGILASSRSEDGNDDGALHYLDVIKSLSSKQLHLHYCIYAAFQKYMNQANIEINAGQGSVLEPYKMYASMVEAHEIGLRPDYDLVVLQRVGLINIYKYDNAPIGDHSFLSYFMVSPCTFGVMVYSIAFNQFDHWRTFSSSNYGEFSNINLLLFTADSLDGLVTHHKN